MKKVSREFQIRKIKDLQEFVEVTREHGLEFPVSEDVKVLGEPIKLQSGKVIPNSMGIHPLEGFDGTEEGAPSETIFRRYDRYARGGAGLIWYESTAIAPDGRCNPLQMILSEETLPKFKELVEVSNKAAVESCGRRPYNAIQLTHSGRRSVDKNWKPTPLAAALNPYMDEHNSVDGSKGDLVIATDEKIEEIVAGFVHAAGLAAQAGFDAVDVKVCHEYILRELLSAFTRPGKYGGSFENRTRALFEIIHGIREEVGEGIDICVRLNAYDCIPYPYGWGMVKEEGVMKPDLTEPIKLCQMLVEEGVQLINLSTMMPRYTPYGNGMMVEYGDGEITPFHGVHYLLGATREIKREVPGGVFMCTGLTWLDQFGANVAAGGKSEGWFDIGGFGRQAFAYPDFARDILEEGRLERDKVCVTCDMCYDMIQGHSITGCACRDEMYKKVYKENILMPGSKGHL